MKLEAKSKKQRGKAPRLIELSSAAVKNSCLFVGWNWQVVSAATWPLQAREKEKEKEKGKKIS